MARFAQSSGKGVMVKKVGNTAHINHQAAAQSAQRYALSPSHGAATASAKVTDRTSPGHPAPQHASRSTSSHNDIDRFTRGIDSHHPYGTSFDGDRMDNDDVMASKDTKQISSLKTPSSSTASRADRKVPQVKKSANRYSPMSENTVSAKTGTGLSDVASRLAKKK